MKTFISIQREKTTKLTPTVDNLRFNAIILEKQKKK